MSSTQPLYNEFIHITEFYETVFSLGVIALFAFSGLAYIFDLTTFIDAFKLNEIQIEENGGQQKQQLEKTEAEKNAVGQISKALAHLEGEANDNDSKGTADNKTVDSKQEEKTVKLTDLPVWRQQFFGVYLSFTEFIKGPGAIIASSIVVGMLTASTLVFSMAMFFTFLFCTLALDFMRVEEKLRMEDTSASWLRGFVKLLPGILMIALFISYWTITEYLS